MPVSSDPGGGLAVAGTGASPARLIFLGGVGEVGRNMACVELGGRILIVDVGLSFPHAEMPGIDLVLPDFEYVRGRFDDVEAVVLTHGHEDHIGALAYLLREVDRPLPVYGTAFTLALLEGKLEEHRVRDRAVFNQVTPGEAATVAFSRTDDTNERALAAYLARHIPGTLYASVVLTVAYARLRRRES